jgi:hypothetical protein
MRPLINSEQLKIDQPLPVPSFQKVELVKRIEEYFLRGPIMLSWLAKAAALPGKAFQVAILVRLQEGINRGRDKWFKVDIKFRDAMRVSRFAWSRGLKSLKAAGLIDYMGHRGKCARIRVIELPEQRKGDTYE